MTSSTRITVFPLIKLAFSVSKARSTFRSRCLASSLDWALVSRLLMRTFGSQGISNRMAIRCESKRLWLKPRSRNLVLCSGTGTITSALEYSRYFEASAAISSPSGWDNDFFPKNLNSWMIRCIASLNSQTDRQRKNLALLASLTSAFILGKVCQHVSQTNSAPDPSLDLQTTQKGG